MSTGRDVIVGRGPDFAMRVGRVLIRHTVRMEIEKRAGETSTRMFSNSSLRTLCQEVAQILRPFGFGRIKASSENADVFEAEPSTNVGRPKMSYLLPKGVHGLDRKNLEEQFVIMTNSFLKTQS